jgi:hypothetical protein
MLNPFTGRIERWQDSADLRTVHPANKEKWRNELMKEFGQKTGEKLYAHWTNVMNIFNTNYPFKLYEMWKESLHQIVRTKSYPLDLIDPGTWILGPVAYTASDLSEKEKEYYIQKRWGRTPVITVQQPYAWLIAEGHKTIETRPCRYPSLVGKWLGIHAGMRVFPYSAEANELAAKGEMPGCFDHGMIVALAHVKESRLLRPEDRELALCDVAGLHGIIFDQVEKVKPVKDRGRRGIWYHDMKGALNGNT